MKSVIKLVIISFLIFFSEISLAQRPVLTEEEEIKTAVTNEIDAMYQSKEFLKQKAKKFNEIHGNMIVDISVIKNGKVSTFFKVDSEITDIHFINFMSNYILDYKFDFKLPRGKQFKIRYSITF